LAPFFAFYPKNNLAEKTLQLAKLGTDVEKINFHQGSPSFCVYLNPVVKMQVLYFCKQNHLQKYRNITKSFFTQNIQDC